MRLLVLGGTVFLGRHLVAGALERGHRVTLFTRGRHNPDLFPPAEHLRGDRDGDLTPLLGRTWDAVLDTSGYVPRVVRGAARLLAGAAGHYTFVSSISVYRDFSRPHLDEGAPVGTLADPSTEEVTGETYGPLKALCEAAVRETLPGHTLVVRPGLIVGPHDPTDRFTYWPWRVAQGGEVLAPGEPGAAAQFVDVRDLAGWLLRLVEEGQTGLYDATSPADALTLGAVLDTCRAVSGSAARLTWVAEELLLGEGVRPWTELPLWVPKGEASMAGFQRIDCRRAFAAGLACRPLEETVGDTLAWAESRPAAYAWGAGLPREREAALLHAWHARSKE